MNDAPGNHELARQLAVLEERMGTMKAEYESALDRSNAAFERLRADMADWKADMADWKTDMADWKTDMVRRDKDNQRWVIGLFVAGIIIIIGAVGFLTGSLPQG